MLSFLVIAKFFPTTGGFSGAVKRKHDEVF
jgi:hypothetical protein